MLLFSILLIAFGAANTETMSMRRRMISFSAIMSGYPDYSGSQTITGSVEVQEQFNGSTTLIVTYDLAGLELSTSGGIHIHEGTSCAHADFVGGHYYNDSLSVDPWTSTWSSNSTGDGSGSFTIDAGILIGDNYGHAIVIHNSDGSRSACGLLGSIEYSSNIGSYPDYSGSYTITGVVAVSESFHGEILINYKLFGLETNTEGGMHIHTGTTCLVADWVGGHYYSVGTDPWDNITWMSNSSGEASGYIIVNSGYNSVSDNLGHAFVIHESSGTRAASGLIGDIREYLVMNIGPYPDYSGSYDSIAGSIVVTEDGSSIRVTYALTGLETNTTGGLHIHEGTTCVAADLVGGHYYDLMPDPWTIEWESNSAGNATNSSVISSGYSIDDNFGHAFIIHQNDGIRAACGLIGAKEIKSELSYYPGYSGTQTISGLVALAETIDGLLLMNFILSGLEVSTSGGIHIHSGTTCLVADMVSGHYYNNTLLDTDPWNSITWTSDTNGDATGNYTVDQGYNTLAENLGHATVVHQSNGTRAACGVLGGGVERLAVMEAYPGYTGDYTITGYVVVAEEAEGYTSLRISYSLVGLEASTSGGMHIHAGTTCSIANLVGGHYYDSDSDPWNTEWTSDSAGEASSYFLIDSGYPNDDNYGHAFVVHLSSDSGSTRAACGLIQTTEIVASFSDYPDYEGTYTITGVTALSVTLEGYLLMNYQISSLEPSTSGGIHIHTGTTCLVDDWVSGHYYSIGTDPWNTTWSSNSSGEAHGTIIINTGYNLLEDNDRHAVVVHLSDGSRAACGLLGEYTEYLAKIEVYPGYTGPQTIKGYVVVAEASDNYTHLEVQYELWGLETNKTGGMHIHAGTTCLNADLVGGHYYTTQSDPWDYSNWTSDEYGNASGSLSIHSGIDINDNFGHVFVVHDSQASPNDSAVRAGCGLIGADEIRADIGSYPDYSGNYAINGTVAIAENLNDELVVNYVLSGLESNITGGIHIHTGTTCLIAGMVLGHYYDSDTLGNDPWNTAIYSSDLGGTSYGSFTINSGYVSIAENLGHAVVIHESGGDRAGCGLLGEVDEYMSIMDTYPDYSGDYTITGYVVVAEEEQDSGNLRVSYSLSGLEGSTSGGMHIHAGTTCSSANLVGDHYYDSESLSIDPWSTEWTSDANGDASGNFIIESNYALDDNYGHAFVIHLSPSEGSTRAACGLFGITEYVATFAEYPGYDGDKSISGIFAVSEDINGELLANYDLAGLETNTSGGIHIHSGTSCALAAMVQGHYYNLSFSSDPWNTITWSSDVSGNAYDYFTIDSGYNTIADNLGHAVVVHESDGIRASCGVIGGGEEYLARMSVYLGYTGEHDINGYVVAADEYDGANTLRITVLLSGLEVSTSGGVHIHEGTTCDDADEVGGHYYNSTHTNGTDPWTTTDWVSDSLGNSSTSFVIDSGYGLEDNLAHAIVIHDSTGSRISCGVLKSTDESSGSSSSGLAKDVMILIIVLVIFVVFLILYFVIKKYFYQKGKTLKVKHQIEIIRAGSSGSLPTQGEATLLPTQGEATL